MANYVPLEEAAKILGVSNEELVEMRSRGEIFGYRDGSSWKFKEEEIERVQAELQGDALDEDAGGSSILVSGREGSGVGSQLGLDANTSDLNLASTSDIGLGSDLRLADDDVDSKAGSNIGSDVKLVADPSSGSGVRLVNRTPDDDDDDLLLAPESDGQSSDIDLGSDLKLAADSGVDLASDLSGGLDLGSGAGSNVGSGIGSGGLGSELDLATDDEDDLVLGSDSGVGLSSESGINLMSPSDSGLSLEDEPLDLAGTGISGLDLGGEVGSGSGSGGGSGSGISGLGSGALIDFEQEEEFQLTPSGSFETDEDSGSQVIEFEDSTEFGDVPVDAGFGDGGFDPVQEDGGFSGFGGGEDIGMNTGAVANQGFRPVAEEPYSGLDIAILLFIMCLLCLSGVLVSDLARNLWAWDGQNNLSTGLTSALVNIVNNK